MHIHMYMAKNVALSNKAYEELSRRKGRDESFSDVVLKLVQGEEKKSIMRFAGIWKDDEEIGRIFDVILKERHKIRHKERKVSW